MKRSMPSVPVPLDVLCNCLAFSSLSDRLRCAVTSRRWQEALAFLAIF